jgi:hypothetical protein
MKMFRMSFVCCCPKVKVGSALRTHCLIIYIYTTTKEKNEGQEPLHQGFAQTNMPMLKMTMVFVILANMHSPNV